MYNNIKFLVPPRISPFSFGEEPLNYGEPTTVTCVLIGGDMPINVTWLLNDQPIHPDDDISLSKVGKHTHILNIDSVNAEHAGDYSCVATNLAGTATQTANLVVNGLFLYPNTKTDNV